MVLILYVDRAGFLLVLVQVHDRLQTRHGGRGLCVNRDVTVTDQLSNYMHTARLRMCKCSECVMEITTKSGKIEKQGVFV